MSLRLWFALFLCGASLAALLVVPPWTLRTGLAIFFAILGGIAFGQLFTRRSRGGGEPSSEAETTEQTLRREYERRRALALLEATMNSMREGLIVVDHALRVVALNRAAREIFSRVEGPLEHKRLSEWTRNPEINSAFKAALSHNKQAEAKVEMQARERQTFDLRVVPLHLGDDDDSSRGAVGVFFDITRLERLERVRQEFLSNVSHELRTPLTAILAFIETLEDGAIDDPDNNLRFLAVIRRNAKRMHNLIDDILELSAIEAGIESFKAEPVRLRALVGDVTTALAGRASARRVTLSNEVSPEVVVLADARRLEQMLTNLVDNAIKFSREHERVTIGHERGARDRISVTDTGDGISSEHLPRIFERFYRVDRARSRDMGGTGLGLAIVKHLARAHGGEVSVNSRPGEGSTFTIELPAVAPEQLAEEDSIDLTAARSL
ncbi:MAG TPA: ATP-binding protein [Pyrinomonadaceae bacterium]|jgi:two-component system phosphate regulon sensor histidine kinase PhoR|nr:ATP-binding protein [Pyrinomonadaceae bacterium]